ncbi:MAG: hypothetical protein AAGI07_14565 [Bacteroidota bacterium]
MEHAEKKELLENIEFELCELIKHDRKNWVRTARLLLIIERDKLFEVRATSYTGYIRKLAITNRIHTSTLWRIKSAAQLYMELTNITEIEKLNEFDIVATPEQLEVYKKVRTIVPEKIMENIKQRMIAGKKVRFELNKLWETYRPLKKGKTERGRKSSFNYAGEMPLLSQTYLPYTKGDQDINLAIESKTLKQYNLDLQKIDKYDLTSEEITITNIKNALRSKYWLEQAYGKIPVYRYQLFQNVVLRHQSVKKSLKADCLAVSFSQKSTLQIPEISAINIRISNNSLKSTRQQSILKNYCNFAIVAVPDKEKLYNEALNILPNYIGIVAVKDQVETTRHQIKMLRLPQYRKIDESYSNTVYRALLLRALHWNTPEKPDVV